MSQALPKAEEKSEERQQSKNLEVSITASSIILNGNPLQLPEFTRRITAELKTKTREQDRIVVVKSAPDTPYPAWIGVSRAIDSAGGILTLEVESERTIEIK
jgi:biopolymer transport protein ExbD